MKRVRPYLPVILIVLPVIILALIRTYAPGNFKPGAQKLGEASIKGNNMLNQAQVADLPGKPLIIKLKEEGIREAGNSSDTLFIKAKELLNRENLKTIRNYKGPVLLVSDDPSVGAKAWMILTQMGYRDLFVLAEKDSLEVLKYKFRPDTGAGI